MARQVVVFLLADQTYGIDIGRVYEIIRSEKPVRLPGMPSYMEGVIHLRERIIPVVDLRVRLDLQQAGSGVAADTGRIVIVDAGAGAMVGLMVDAVQEVRDLPDGSVQPPPVNAGLSGYVEGIALSDGQLIILLDAGKIFSQREAGDFMTLADGSGKGVAAVV